MTELSIPERPKQVVPTTIMADTLSTGKSLQSTTVLNAPIIVERTVTTAMSLPSIPNNATPHATVAVGKSTKRTASKSTALGTKGMCNTQLTPEPLTNASTERRSPAESTDPEDEASDWAAAHSPVNLFESDAEVSTSYTQGSAPLGKESVTKKVLKRARAKSAASTGGSITGKITKKRVRTSAVQRQAPSAKTELPLDNGELA